MIFLAETYQNLFLAAHYLSNLFTKLKVKLIASSKDVGLALFLPAISKAVKSSPSKWRRLLEPICCPKSTQVHR